MSIQAVSWVLDKSQSRGFARLVLIAIANHVNKEDGEWSLPQRVIAFEAGISVGSVPDNVRKLVTLGEVEVVYPGDARNPARYRMTFTSAQQPSADDFHSAQEMSAGAARSARPGLSAARGPGPRAIEEPSLPSLPSAGARGRCETCGGTRHVLHPTERNRLRRCPDCTPRAVSVAP